MSDNDTSTTPPRDGIHPLTIIEHSPDPEAADPRENRRPSIAARIRDLGEARKGALLLLIATAAAIAWANISAESYHGFWETQMTIGLGDLQLAFTLHALVNDALMAIFFFTVGLEVRREFAIGELTSWRRAMIPVMAAIAGLIVPAVLFLLISAGSGQEHAWGVVISTDTAFLVGALALIGPKASGRLRVFLLALAVVDDIGALSIIALFYTQNFSPMPLLVAAVGLAGIYATRFLRRGRGPIYATLAIIVWLAFLASGVHPTLAGVAIALLIPVYRPNRRDVEQALELARTFRQSPNSEYARQAANSLRESISINERLQSAYAPYVAYVILPLFALANAGVELSGPILAAAVRSPITWAIVVGLVVGKFLGVFGAAAIMKVFRLGEFGLGLTLDRIAGGAALCGIGFTISLFIVDLAITDEAAQNEARVGVLAASVIAFVLSWAMFRISDARRPDDDGGRTLVRAVDPARDRIYGPVDAPLTIVEYGDFQCEFCLKASGSIEEVRRELGDRLRYVWRHAPLERFHPNALAGAEAFEAATLQGKGAEFSRSLFADQQHQLPSDIIRRARELDLDIDRFERDLESAQVTGRVRDDMLDAEAMDITSVPTFYVNGVRHVGPYDAQSLIRALTEQPA
ncbi:Na+/H+ antiporter NhaA [Microbacterium terrae]|uniref:Na(+)/H(+) antiporter NhaA n=1 Tax=Microbacterium terrae TaxID=69369 RepID=A0A0M2HI39_9MICO|nr:Na+/H+ antiporter NhaA [Microbacterium terrae]KJL43970.1 Na(+)/H(+) antiporter NhaA [Microbacterium terrae]MBP1077822.1 Na+/H+ antiporter NhaA [Microbacterium terrae]GLJ99991.1 Na(+)/H(+) antiporter NhaA 2 [Microbacterium terrae]